MQARLSTINIDFQYQVYIQECFDYFIVVFSYSNRLNLNKKTEIIENRMLSWSCVKYFSKTVMSNAPYI